MAEGRSNKGIAEVLVVTPARRREARHEHLHQARRRAPAPRTTAACSPCSRSSVVAGIRARTSVPAPRRALDLERAVERADAVGEAAQPGPAAGVRAADAVVADVDHRVAVLAPRRRPARASRSAYLATLVSASATTK